MSDLYPYPFDQATQYYERRTPGFTFGTPVDATPAGAQWVEGEKQGWTVVDPATEDPNKLYRLMGSAILPRPVAYVSTVSEGGIDNLAPFSFFNMVSHNPPMVSVCIRNDDGSRTKDTEVNIRETKSFVVNIMSTVCSVPANTTALDTPSDVSEWELSGLTKAPSVLAKAPRVKESAFSMECELYEAIGIVHPETGAPSVTLVLGLVKKIHVRNDVLLNRESSTGPEEDIKLVDPTKFDAIGRMGDISYASFRTLYRLSRPAWAEEKEEIERLGLLSQANT